MAKRTLRSTRQAMAARRAVLRKDVTAFHHAPVKIPKDGEYKAYAIIRLCVGADKYGRLSAHPFLTQVPASRRSPFVEPFIKAETVSGVIAPRFTRAFLSVRITAEAEKRKGMANLFEQGVVLLDNRFYVPSPYHKGALLELCSGNEAERSVIYNENGRLREGAFWYGGLKRGYMTASNGQVKKLEITLPCHNLEGFSYKEVLNSLLFGLPDLIEANPRFFDTAKPFAQASTRVAQIDAPAVEGKYLDNFAVFMGIYDSLWDGEIYLQDDYVASWYEDRLGTEQFGVLRSAVRGITLQCRPYLCKGNGSVVSARYLNRVLSRYPDAVVLTRTSITPEEQEAFNEAVWSKGKKGAFAGKLVVLCDDIEQLKAKGVQVFTDLNGLKETFDLTRKSGLNVLDVTEESEDVHLSTQTWATLMVADEMRAKRIFEERVNEAIGSTFNRVFASRGSAVTAADIANTPSLMQLGDRVFPQFMRKCWQPGWRSTVKGAVTGLTTRISNCSLKNDGTYDVFVVDAALDFGFKGLLFESGICEVFCKDIVTEAMLVRFPKANAFGFSIVRPVTVEVILERGRAAGLSEEDLELLKERLEVQANGIVMLPASASLMAKHDGHDYDGDHGQLTVDTDTVDIVKGMESMVVHICEDKDEFNKACEVHKEEDGNIYPWQKEGVNK